jgi:hypothetical protein
MGPMVVRLDAGERRDIAVTADDPYGAVILR